MKVLYENNSQSCFNDEAFVKFTRMILLGAFCMNLDRAGKFLSAIVETTDELLREIQ